MILISLKSIITGAGLDPQAYEASAAQAVRTTHRTSNDRSLSKTKVTMTKSRATARLPLPKDRRPPGLAIIVQAVTKTDVHQGICPLPK